MSDIRIGISGWTFDAWRGPFYPDGVKRADELAFASRKVSSIEINGTFHSLFKPANYQAWYEATPPDFVFAVKGPKYITHERRLKDFETPLSNFLASGILALGEKLGPILWQFPPTLPFTAERFEPFMKALPHEAKEAARLGTGHSTWLEGRTFLAPATNFRLRHAIEGRHDSFKSPEFVAMAKKYGIAVVVGDTAGRQPYIEDVTTDFVYIRLHGDETVYPDGYTKEAMVSWAERMQTWAEGGQPADAKLVVPGAPPAQLRLVYAYFDNDVKDVAPLNAVSMIAHLEQSGLILPRAVEPLVAAPKKAPKAAAKPKAKPAAKPKAKPTAKRARA
jgi:uncharacterized protein YecE (DUF72 family)